MPTQDNLNAQNQVTDIDTTPPTDSAQRQDRIDRDPADTNVDNTQTPAVDSTQDAQNPAQDTNTQTPVVDNDANQPTQKPDTTQDQDTTQDPADPADTNVDNTQTPVVDNAQDSITDTPDINQDQDTTQDPADTADKEALREEIKKDIEAFLTPKEAPFMEEIHKLLQDNQAWIEQIRVTLSINGELYNSFYALQHYYKGSIQAIRESLIDNKELKNDLVLIKNKLENRATAFEALINLKEAKLDELEIRVEHNTEIALNTLSQIQELKNEADLSILELETLKRDIKDTQRLFEEIGQERSQLSQMIKQSVAIVKEFESLRQKAIKELNTATEDGLNTLTTSLNTHKQNLNAHKGDLSTELTEKKNALILELEAVITHIDNKIQELEQSFVLKQAKIDETLEAIIKANETFANTLHNALRDLEMRKAELSHSLEVEKNLYLEDLIAHKSDLVTEFNEEAQTLSTDLREQYTDHRDDLTNIRDEYLRTLANQSVGTISALKQEVAQLRQRQQVYGSNYVTVNFTANATFQPIPNVSYYYVFIRGGTGVNNSSKAGNPTTFGELLTAEGGAGNANGYGQKGEAKACFLLVENDVEMTIPTGGIISISYATKAEADPANPTFSINDITLIPTTKTLRVGDSFSLNLTPQNSGIQVISATVEDNTKGDFDKATMTFTARAEGSTTLTLQTELLDQDRDFTCAIVIEPAP